MKLTRVVIVKDGKVEEFWADEWAMSLQDDGRTLKLFGKGGGDSARRERAEGLREFFRDSPRIVDEIVSKIRRNDG